VQSGVGGPDRDVVRGGAFSPFSRDEQGAGDAVVALLEVFDRSGLASRKLEDELERERQEE